MRARPWGAALVVLGLLALAFSLVAGWSRQRRPSADVVSVAGGFSVDLPDGWVLDDGARHPVVWLEAKRASLLGPADQWLWVARFTAAEEDPLGAARAGALDDIRTRFGVDEANVTVVETRLGGERALRLGYSRPTGGPFGWIPGDRIKEVRFLTASGSQVYEVGVGGWRSLPDIVRRIDDRVRLRPIEGSRRLRGPGFTLRLPAAFNERPAPYPDAPNARWIAFAPGEWVMVWAFDDPVARTRADSLAAIEREGQLLAQEEVVVSGRPATRFEFDQVISGRPAHLVTWHLRGDDGRAWQVLVGGRETMAKTAAMVEATFSFTP